LAKKENIISKKQMRKLRSLAPPIELELLDISL